MFTPRLSESECAGSVENSRIELCCLRFLRRKRAVADAAVVLPTPPLPPKKRYRLTCCVVRQSRLRHRQLRLQNSTTRPYEQSRGPWPRASNRAGASLSRAGEQTVPLRAP